MRSSDLNPGIIIQVDAISPEVQRAQRMAELRDMAEYRARHLKAIQDWSDPAKRAKIQAEHAAAERRAREEMSGKYIDDYRVRTVKDELFIAGLPEAVKLSPVHKSPNLPKRKRWYYCILDWFR